MPRVLILDSNPNLILIFVQALRRAGFEVQAATTIQQARRLLSEQTFDVLLSDTHIDEQDQPLGLLRQKCNAFTKKTTKTIMMSSHIRYERICRDLGADIFLEKPVAVDRLITLVSRLTH